MLKITIRPALASCFTAAVAVFLSSCASSGPQVAQPDATLVNKASNMYARSRFSQAVDLYRKTVEENPDSPYRKQSVLGLADSLYKDKNYGEAALYYERFTELYPLDALTARSYFYQAMCFYHDTHEADRDQTNTKKAIGAFSRFVDKYPNDLMAPLARQYIAEMDSLLAGSRMEIARYYHRVGKNSAAIGRLNDFLDEYPDSIDVNEALFMLGESYYREQSFKEAAQVFIKLIEKDPAGEFGQKAAAIAQSIKLKEGSGDN